MTVPTVGGSAGFAATQSYAYDSLNRLQSATETVASSQTWKQTFLYDRYGNRQFDAANTTTLGSCATAVCNPTIATSNNRFSSGQGYGYNANGDLTQDATGWLFVYDAESRQTSFGTGGSSTNGGAYLYNGEGKRVKKVTNAETTIFVYDAGGQLAAEYSTQIAQTPQVSYLTTDHLGSPRIITNENGAVTSRKDFAAFGDETITAQRTTGLGYNPPSVRQDYTGYQKDSESNLEYAQARYYNSSHGRFTSVDPLTASASIRNPQTFNRYSYALNSPYKFTDPLGLAVGVNGNPPAQPRSDTLPPNCKPGQLNCTNQPTPPPPPPPSDPPIIDLVKVSLVDSLPSERTEQDELVAAENNNDIALGGSSLDARINASEVRKRFEQNQPVFLRVDLALVGDGSFTSPSDTTGAQSVAISTGSANNLNVVTTPKNLSGSVARPSVDAAATSVSVYTRLTVSDPSKPASLIVTVTARANYQADRFEGGKLQVGKDRDRTRTTPFKIRVKYSP